jgi:hypothetical protein
MKKRARGKLCAREILLLLAMVLLGAASGFGQDDKPKDAAPAAKPSDKPDKSKKGKEDDAPTTKLRIVVTGGNKPIGNASVYVRFNSGGGFLKKDKLLEMNLKTNEDGTAKVPDIPRGKTMIQVVAKGWHTFGKWYDIEKEEETIEVKLEPPPHWY